VSPSPRPAPGPRGRRQPEAARSDAPRGGSSREPSGVDKLEALLRDLGPRLRRGPLPAEAPARLPTGLAELDRLLGGGFPVRRLSEIAGPASSGRTSVALALLAQVTRTGRFGAVVDAADAFDPASAEAAGAQLERVLWVRPPGLREALRSSERLLEAGGFALVLLDRAAAGPAPARAVWPRLARAAQASDSALVVLHARRAAGSAAELAVEMKAPAVRFSGTPLLLDGLEIEAALVRQRAGPAARSACLRLRPRAAA
jgi:hypothetical protein